MDGGARSKRGGSLRRGSATRPRAEPLARRCAEARTRGATRPAGKLARTAGSIACILLALAHAAPGRAAEIDSLSGRDQRLRDSKAALEDLIDDALRSGIAHANEGEHACDEAALYREIRRAFASPFIGHSIAEALNDDERLDRRRVLRVDSIYRDLGVLDAVSVHWKDLSAVVEVDGVVIGVDKIGHFVVEGWSYFERAYLDEEGVEASMAWGEGTEDTYFGRYTTGVRSYADLVANFEGMRFWRRVIGRGDDPLEGRAGRQRPYVRCGRFLGPFGERRWRLRHGVDLADYVTPVWDEAVNCCAYRNEEIQALVEARIAELSTQAGRDLSCPLDARACARARERYGEWAYRVLHPDCLTVRVPRRPWWQPWR